MALGCRNRHLIIGLCKLMHYETAAWVELRRDLRQHVIDATNRWSATRAPTVTPCRGCLLF
jgi:hypothetical protein